MLTRRVKEFNETFFKDLQRYDYDKIIFEKNNLKAKDADVIQELLERGHKVTVITDEKSMQSLYERLKRRLPKQILQEEIEIIFDTLKK